VNPDLEYFDVKIAQGRWNERFIKNTNGHFGDFKYFETDEKVSVPPGLTI
jgi:hypothetical protein